MYRLNNAGALGALLEFAPLSPIACIRGLSSLIILEQLMETIDSDSPPKPCDYFDMIGGTSTGGLVVTLRVDCGLLC